MYFSVFIPFALVCLGNKAIYLNNKFVLISIVYIFYILFGSGFGFNAIREFASFFLFLLLYFVFSQSLSYGYNKIILNWAVFSSFFYFFFALLQSLFGKYIFDFIVVVRSSENRGVTSITPEPTFFGIISLLLIFIILLASDYKLSILSWFAVVINIFSIFFLSKSALSILLFFSFFVIYSFVSFFFYFDIKKIIKSFVIFLLFFGFSFLVYFFSSGSNRYFKLVSMVFNGEGGTLFNADASINMRVAGLFFPFYLSVKSFLMPLGFGTISSNLMLISHEFDGLFIPVVFENDRIMSFIGSFVYCLGWGGIYILSVFFYRSMSSRCFDKRSVVESLFIFCILMNAVPVALPLVPILFAFMMNRNNRRVS